MAADWRCLTHADRNLIDLAAAQECKRRGPRESWLQAGGGGCLNLIERLAALGGNYEVKCGWIPEIVGCAAGCCCLR